MAALFDFYDEAEEVREEKWIDAAVNGEEAQIKAEEEIKEEEIHLDFDELNAEATPMPLRLDQVEKLHSEAKWFECENCDYKSKEWVELYSHKISKHSSEWLHWLRGKDEHASGDEVKSFKCGKCDFKAKHRQTLQGHVTSEHPMDAAEIRWFKCEKCDFKCKLSFVLQRHMINVHLMDAAKFRMFGCEKCNYVTKFKTTLEWHVRSKHFQRDEGEEKIKAEEEIKKEEVEFDFKEVIADQNPDATPMPPQLDQAEGEAKWFECEKCDYKSREWVELYSHKINKHSTQWLQWLQGKDEHPNGDEVKWFKCGKCDFKAERKRTLQAHENNEHPIDASEIKWFKCGKCAFKSKLKFNLQRHMVNIHQMDAATLKCFKCNKCSYVTKFRTNLEWHVSSKHIKGEEKEEAKQIKELILDQKNHDSTPEATPISLPPVKLNYRKCEAKWFECEKCDYKSKEWVELYSHKINKHSSEWLRWLHGKSEHAIRNEVEWFKCEKCDFKAELTFDLDEHMINKHPPDAALSQRFKCEKCNYETKFKGHLQMHIIRKHRNESRIKLLKCEKRDEYKAKHLHAVEITRFKCENCDYATKFKGCLQWHMTRKHQLLKCEKCVFKTKHRPGLQRHINATHFMNANEIKRLKCNMHVIKEHSGEDEIFKCEKCSCATKYKLCEKCAFKDKLKFNLQKFMANKLLKCEKYD